ncbi:muts domain V-domain-containing protein [Lipomyces tetrasporus]
MSARKVKASAPPVGSQTSAKKQRTLASFFGGPLSTKTKKETTRVSSHLDSDPVLEVDNESRSGQKNKLAQQALPSPTTPNTSSDVKDESRSPTSSGASTPTRRAKVHVRYKEDSDDDAVDEFVATRTQSRKRMMRTAINASDDEFVPVAEDDSFEHMSEIDNDEEITDVAEKKLVNVSKPSRPSSLASKFAANSPSTHAASATRKFETPKLKDYGKKKSFEAENEERYSWLVDVKDADGHPLGHPDYDPRTLHIPKSAWVKFTAFETQYWEVKSKMFDTVVFFKKGKFYELYENDADIAHSEFDLRLAGGGRANMRLAGVPEMSFDHWAASFIAKGYKVARVDQAETLLGKEMREKGGKKEEKIIRRELSCVLTGGTLVDETMLVDEMSTFCVAIKEWTSETGTPNFGICFVDTATGAFSMTEIEDDADYNLFQTVVAQLRPKELILEKGCISSLAIRIIKNSTSPGTLWNYLKPRVEFWDEDIAFEELSRGAYFPAENLDDHTNWPEILKTVTEKPLALSAFGGLLWYLQWLKIDKELVTLGNFSWYDPVRMATSLVLDGQSLQNLEIFANSFDGGDQGTLFRLLNRCITPFGKRLLKTWVCHPLRDIGSINARFDAVELLNHSYDLQDTLDKGLASLPDLERLVSRIHAGKCKVKDFVRVIEGFESIYEVIVKLQTEFELGGIIGKLIQNAPPLDECLAQWRDAFDRQKAKSDGLLIPERGVEEDFDCSQDNISRIEQEFTELLRGYKRQFKSQEITYKDSGKEIYLIEVPTRIVSSIPKNWQQLSGTQKTKRFWSPEVRTLVRQMLEARETHKNIVSEMQMRLYAKFDKFYSHWIKAAQLVANLDCLLSLAKTSASLGSPSCRPVFIDDERSMLNFAELRHPCYSSEQDFIPNDILLGGASPNITLLTGANAAGKSTVLRMTCIAVIMAQIGCYVPAANACLTTVDRIMTRLGANDNIFAGQSTFYVELAETKKMLSQATSRSLLVLDELGRGGSSSDGFAIAESVLHHIATHVGSLGFFATHYGTLASSFDGHPEVEPKRMAILVDEEERKVTFLYRLENGVSPGSFGMHVASMCGIDKMIVDDAEIAATEFEHTSQVKKLLETTNDGQFIPLGLQSDFSWLIKLVEGQNDDVSGAHSVHTILKAIDRL